MLALRKLPLYELPETGRIVITDSFDIPIPVAAGFMRKCEGKLLIWDGLITNPDINADLRNEALDLISTALIDDAKALNAKGIIAWSSDEMTLLRSKRHGFNATDDQLIFLSL